MKLVRNDIKYLPRPLSCLGHGNTNIRFVYANVDTYNRTLFQKQFSYWLQDTTEDLCYIHFRGKIKSSLTQLTH